MSYDYRFEPPSAAELEEMGTFRCPFHFKCKECCFDCEFDEGDEDE